MERTVGRLIAALRKQLDVKERLAGAGISDEVAEIFTPALLVTEDGKLDIKSETAFVEAVKSFANTLTAEDIAGGTKAGDFAKLAALVGRDVGRGIPQETMSDALEIIGSVLADHDIAKERPRTRREAELRFTQFLSDFVRNWVAPADSAIRAGGNILDSAEVGGDLYMSLRDAYMSHYEVATEELRLEEEPPINGILDAVDTAIQRAQIDWASFSDEAKRQYSAGELLSSSWARELIIQLTPALRFYLLTEGVDVGGKVSALLNAVLGKIQDADIEEGLKSALKFTAIGAFIRALADVVHKEGLVGDEDSVVVARSVIEGRAKELGMPQEGLDAAVYLHKKRSALRKILREILIYFLEN